VTFAAGLATEGYKPFCAIYSTFLQRGYDQIVHDVAIQSLPVRFAIDRAGLVGADGATHAGSFDNAYLGCLPNFVIMAASDEAELVHMVATQVAINDRPSALRYPRGEGRGIEMPEAGVALENRHGRYALIAIQGPRSVEMLQPHVDVDLASMRYYFCAQGRVDGVPALIARTGYTGEDGFELFVEGQDAAVLWSALLRDHRGEGLEPCGLGARDVLRLEAGMPLYGHELTETITPVQAGLNWALKLNKPEFIGRDALARQLERDDYPRVAGLVMEGRAPAREGYAVSLDGRVVGQICSGSIAPSVGNKNVATALLERDAATLGTAVAVQIRGTLHDAKVVPLPFYKRAQ